MEKQQNAYIALSAEPGRYTYPVPYYGSLLGVYAKFRDRPQTLQDYRIMAILKETGDAEAPYKLITCKSEFGWDAVFAVHEFCYTIKDGNNFTPRGDYTFPFLMVYRLPDGSLDYIQSPKIHTILHEAKRHSVMAIFIGDEAAYSPTIASADLARKFLQIKGVTLPKTLTSFPILTQCPTDTRLLHALSGILSLAGLF